jgi:hypothetical protein
MGQMAVKGHFLSPLLRRNLEAKNKQNNQYNKAQLASTGFSEI